MKKKFLLLGLVVVAFLGMHLKSEAATVDVTTWTGGVNSLEAALSDESNDVINVTNSLVATKNLRINRNVTINFNAQTVNIKTYSLEVTVGNELKVNNLNFTGESSGTVFNGLGSVIASGNINSLNGNIAAMATMAGGSFTFDNAKVNYDRGSNQNEGIMAKYFEITNASNVTSNCERFFGINGKVYDGTIVKINKGSKVTTNSMKKTTANSRGQAWRIESQADIYINGVGTELNVNGNGQQRADDGGIFLLVANNSTINVDNGAKFIVTSQYASGVLLQSKGGSLNVNRGSLLKITQAEDDGYSLGAALRFRIEGSMTFNIENESTIEINKLSGRAPGIRMYGGNNIINIKSDSNFVENNQGDGTPRNPVGNAQNQGILYVSGGNNAFNLSGKKSNVTINADNGPAIDSEDSIDINVGEGTYFVARGKTSSKGTTGALYKGTLMRNNITNPRYFDFTNNNNQGALYRNTSSSIMTAYGTDLSVWATGSDLKGKPTRSWPHMDFTLQGAQFGTIQSSTNTDFTNTFGKMANYARITANNQSAKVTSIHIPTNADKFIYIKAVVPEGKSDQDRAPYDGEVGVRIGLFNSNGEKTAELSGKTTTTAIYEGIAQQGIIKIPVPNDKFIEAGMTVKVLSAWRGDGFENDPNSHVSPPEYLEANPVTVLDVTPPKTVSLDGETINNGMSQLSGSCIQDGAKIFIKVDGDWLRDAQGTPVSSQVVVGKWTVSLPTTPKVNANYEFFAKEDMSIDKTQLGYVLPTTHTNEPDGQWGNTNVPVAEYVNYSGYHDAIKEERFSPSLKVKVTDVMPDTPQITKLVRALTKDSQDNQIPQTTSSPIDPSEWQGTTTRVGNTLAYRIIVQVPGTPGQNNEKVIYNAKVTDVIPEFLMFDKGNVKVWKYTKGDADGAPIRHLKNVSNSDGTRQFNLGDINLEETNATEITQHAIITYQGEQRLLTVGVGDTQRQIKSNYVGDNQYGTLLPGEKVVIEIPTTVTTDALKKKIQNKATVTGNSGIIKTQTPLEYVSVSAESKVVENPGGEITGELKIESAPDVITFDSTNISDYKKTIGSDKTCLNKPLIIKDTLRTQDWEVTVKLTEEIYFEKNKVRYELANSLIVRYKDQNHPVVVNQPYVIYKSNIETLPKDQEEVNISNDWSKLQDKDGIKIKASKIPRAEKYVGTLEWSLANTQ